MMYDDIKINWRTIAVHDEFRIYGFFGEYRFLSNFQPCITKAGWPSTENGYMAAKVKAEYRAFFKTCTPREAKLKWKEFPLVDASAAEWDNRKYEVMYDLLCEKFDPTLNPELSRKLLATGNKELVEKNWWRDVYWGVDTNLGGQNMLGIALMNIRSRLRDTASPG